MKALQNNSNNVISLFQTNDMAIERSDPFSIGNYHMGKIGTEWMVWNSKFTKTFKLPEKKQNDFTEAKKKAYEFILEDCTAKQIVPPPPPV